MTQIFCNRPDYAVSIDALLQDLESATQHVLQASSWFTDHTIAQTIIDSHAGLKLAFLNKNDIQRREKVAYRRLIEAPSVHVCVLGTASFEDEDSVMHHKCCVIDRVLVGTGSSGTVWSLH